MNKRIKTSVFTLFLFITFFFITFDADGEVFEFKHIEGARYRILSVVDEAVFVNGILSHRSELLNRIALENTGVSDGIGAYSAVFQSSERLLYHYQYGANTAAGYVWSSEYESEFVRDKLGHLAIDQKFFMPVVRNVPVFPGKSLAVGERWYAPAYEAHDFRAAFGIEDPYIIPFNAFYQYLGERQWKGTSYPAFSVNYNIESRPPPVLGRLYPVRISGTFSQIVYWNREIGKEAAYEEEFRITFTMSD
ncbi:MAG: OmpA family protein, partial [Treponema sp.]|nr:OmpA family protein [Treponema sp.]